MTNFDPETEEGRSNVTLLYELTKALALQEISGDYVNRAADMLGFSLSEQASVEFRDKIVNAGTRIEQRLLRRGDSNHA